MSIEKIQAFFQPMKGRLKGVYSYGTAFTEYERDDSDVDIAVLPYIDKPLDWRTLAKWGGELEGILGKQVDLIDLENINTVMQVQVTYYGRRIVTFDENACEWFESRVFWNYITLNEDRKYILEDIEKRGTIF